MGQTEADKVVPPQSLLVQLGQQSQVPHSPTRPMIKSLIEVTDGLVNDSLCLDTQQRRLLLSSPLHPTGGSTPALLAHIPSSHGVPESRAFWHEFVPSLLGTDRCPQQPGHRNTRMRSNEMIRGEGWEGKGGKMEGGDVGSHRSLPGGEEL